MKLCRYFYAASSVDALRPDCGHEHPSFGGAVDCAKRRGFGEVWSVEVKRMKKFRRAKTKVGTSS